MNMQEKFYNALKSLVEISEDAQSNRDSFYGLSIKSWAKEHCTIKLAGPRRSGHTTSALRLIQEKFKKCILVSPNRNMMLHVEEISHRMGIHDKIKFVSNDLDGLRGHSGDYDAVIIDGTWGLSSKKIDEIYSVIPSVVCSCRPFYKNTDPFFFIFLQ